MITAKKSVSTSLQVAQHPKADQIKIHNILCYIKVKGCASNTKQVFVTTFKVMTSQFYFDAFGTEATFKARQKVLNNISPKHKRNKITCRKMKLEKQAL